MTKINQRQERAYSHNRLTVFLTLVVNLIRFIRLYCESDNPKNGIFGGKENKLRSLFVCLFVCHR